VDDVGVIALEERADLRRPDLVRGGAACQEHEEDERAFHSSNVSDAQRLSQSAFDAGGAGIICTDLISHTPRFGSLNATRPFASERARRRSDASSRCMAMTSAPASGFDSYTRRTSMESAVIFSGTIS